MTTQRREAEQRELRRRDVEARRVARSVFDRPVWIEAGAGTGKTTVLVERILSWCLGPGFDAVQGEGEDVAPQMALRVFESVVALTFSEAAAAEMEARTAGALGDLAQGLLPKGVSPGLLAEGPLAELAEATLCRRARVLLEHCDHLTALTLHAFCARLLRAFPLEAGVDPAFQIDAQGADRARVVRELLETWLEEPPPGRGEDLAELAEEGLGPAEVEGLVVGLLGSRLTAADLVQLDPAEGHEMVFAPLKRVLVEAMSTCEGRLRDAGSEGFDGLLRRALELVERHPAVVARLRGELRQLLVDEFQDTDFLQCRILEHLAVAGPVSNRPILFLVGDPKQSIYGWRSADLRSYHEFTARVAALPGAESHRLSLSYRAPSVLLDEVEAITAPLLVHEPGLQAAFQPLVAARSEESGAPPAGFEYWIAGEVDPDTGRPADKTEAEVATAIEAKAAAGDIARAHREGGIAWRDIAVLLRSAGDLEVYLDALRRAGIPYATAREEHGAAGREIRDAEALLRCLLDPNDQIALVAALRSPRCGIPDAAWPPLWRRQFPRTARWALLGEGTAARERSAELLRDAARELARRGPSLPAAPEAWQESAVHFLDVLCALRRSLDEEPFDAFIARLRRLTLLEAGEAALELGAHRLANTERWFRTLLTHYESSGGNLAALCRALRRSGGLPTQRQGPTAGGVDAVQVLTIHGAKGLEFERVYLLQAQRGTSRQAGSQIEVERGDTGFAVRLPWGLRKEQCVESSGFAAASERRTAVTRAEQVRTLYVAMTRARRSLVVSGRLDKGEARKQRSHADLLSRTLAPALREARAAAAPGRGRVESGGRPFVFLALTGPAGPETSGRKRVPGTFSQERAVPPTLEARRTLTGSAAPAPPSPRSPQRPSTLRLPVIGDAERRTALARAAKPYRAAASSRDAGSLPAPDELVGRPSAIPAGPSRPTELGRELAREIGIALHSFFERFDWATPDEERAFAAEQEVLIRELEARVPGGSSRRAALRRANALLARLRRGRLWAQLRALAPYVLGREVPVLIPPELDRGPLCCTAGTIDFVYRDSQSGQLVAADYKSGDADRGIPLRERGERYRSQGMAYCQALTQAWELSAPPRFELWFLDADTVIAL